MAVLRLRQCKRMRVKCDETKPTCTKCLKANRSCQYRQINTKPCLTVPQQKILLPKGDAFNHTESNVLLVQPRLTDLAAHEVPYFDLFRHQMAHDFAYTPCTLFWNRVIPREAMSDGCVRSSVLSIGALMQSLYRLGPKPYTSLITSSGRSRSSHDKTYRIALNYHSKAISGLQARMRNHFATVSRRNILINMFLLFLFELMHGNTAAADRMLTSSNELLKQKGDHLLSEVSAGFQQQPQPIYTAPSNDEGLDQAERILPRLQVFLSLNSRFFPLQKDCWSRFSAKATLSHVPSLMADFVQFGAAWNSFITRAVIFVVKTMQEAPSLEPAQITTLANYRNTFSRELRQWEHAIVQRSHREANSVVKRTLKIFHIGQKVVHILLSCCFDSTETEYDNHENTFSDIMAMIHSMADEAQPATRIETVLDIYVLPVLNFVSQKCRNYSTRLDALDLFERMVSQMGGWETRASLLVRRRLMDLEELGRTENGDIAAGQRYIWTDACWDEGRTCLNVSFQNASRRKFGQNDPSGLIKIKISLMELEG
ncbi:hypothetical protein EDB82DRAFT_473582 [Fusarium venenatum]|uniref:uncharacterized protein n=1 Tax=Fusarium venenatum TaxID=56646 RepID=UPI001D2FE680|nr:hypothetical protein EDB82DRAFT_473582 [Fusarium venenatum]